MTVEPASGVAFATEIPVLIVGAGAAGLIAALAARSAGAEPLVLERDAVPAGSTALSAGLIPAAGTRWQEASGIADSPAAFARDILAKAHGEPDPAIVDLVSRHSATVLHWLADRHGFEFSVLDDFRYPGHGACRMHGLPSRSGRELVDQLRSAAEAAGIDILCDAHVTTVYAEGGVVRGVAATRPDGTVERIGCGALILACNGYGGSKALIRQHIPGMADALYFGHAGNQGDALLWGEALGAASRDLSGHQGHGSVAHPAGILITWATITEGGVQVNTAGERFSNEAAGYSEQGAAVLGQPGGVAWTVFDARIAAIARQFEDFRQAEAAGCILFAGSVPDLAASMRVDPGRTRGDAGAGRCLEVGVRRGSVRAQLCWQRAPRQPVLRGARDRSAVSHSGWAGGGHACPCAGWRGPKAGQFVCGRRGGVRRIRRRGGRLPVRQRPAHRLRAWGGRGADCRRASIHAHMT